jgi:hypothetical protein
MLAHPTRLKEVLVERFSFSSDVAFVPRGDLLDHVSLAPLTPSSAEGQAASRGLPQILAVLDAAATEGGDEIQQHVRSSFCRVTGSPGYAPYPSIGR